MTETLDLLCNLRSDVDVITGTLMHRKDLTGETLPEIDPYSLECLKMAREITERLMNDVEAQA